MRPLGVSEPREIGRFRLIAELGRGGMGRVWLGAGPDGRLVAVKQVHAHLVEEDGFRARFHREVRATLAVPGNYTSTVIDADAEAPTPWLASEFISGPSLREAVEVDGPLPEKSALRLAAGLASALVLIHEAGLVHRDIKPSNVLLAEDGPRLIDFGIARALDRGSGRDLTRTGLVVGSPEFMSPEQAQAQEITPASDIFSLGALLAMAVTGNSVFAGQSDFQVLHNIVHTEPDLDGVPTRVRAVAEACLAKNPAARPSAERLLESIGRVAPSARPWPAHVHTLTSTQYAEIDRLIENSEPDGGPEPTPRKHTRLQARPINEWDAESPEPNKDDAGQQREPGVPWTSRFGAGAREVLAKAGAGARSMSAKASGGIRSTARGIGRWRPTWALNGVLVLVGVLFGVLAANFIMDGRGVDQIVIRMVVESIFPFGTVSLVLIPEVFGILAGATLGVVLCALISTVSGPRAMGRTLLLRRALLVGVPVVGFVLGRLAARGDLDFAALNLGGRLDGRSLMFLCLLFAVIMANTAVSTVSRTFSITKNRRFAVQFAAWVIGFLASGVTMVMCGLHGWIGIVVDGRIPIDVIAILGGCIGGSWALRIAIDLGARWRSTGRRSPRSTA
ncbi:serine/threonine-protein kinase [Actinoalloteichus hymeniacidonis]|uniref:Serine/threonine protein kinase n=1 Tax=Actinoalloteichus hymeniacidonis TaxID=340345 RepID=A0AAC9HR60_9PSEU|nr:serine/threonine-protein kinase [Actinoalloteichus hymeniacidonis]AOS63925.1 serine/threonine protein kinase [Actinoalloteichus hymeniacidonis]MBB5908019.1 serine/threonine protein kinase [Actinoalloteichus hymeniacidonis]